MENNLVEAKTASGLWIPRVIFRTDFTSDEQPIGLSPGGLMAVRRKGKGHPAGLEELREHLYYKGSENTLTYNYTEERTFKCDYKLGWYPFDNQHCLVLVNDTL